MTMQDLAGAGQRPRHTHTHTVPIRGAGQSALPVSADGALWYGWVGQRRSGSRPTSSHAAAPPPGQPRPPRSGCNQRMVREGAIALMITDGAGWHSTRFSPPGSPSVGALSLRSVIVQMPGSGDASGEATRCPFTRSFGCIRSPLSLVAESGRPIRGIVRTTQRDLAIRVAILMTSKNAARHIDAR
jgi:hypothetical protein